MSTETPHAETLHAETLSAETAHAEAPHEHRLSKKKFVLHYLEMVVAMAVGMVALHPVWSYLLDALDASWLMRDDYTGALIMATNMTVAMSAWMRFRGHGWRPIAEMGAAMYLPFLVLFVPLAFGLITAGGMMLWGHIGMLFAMGLAMALRPAEYAHC
ncbi:hypothetical protein [Geodermatophilus sp. SYSU D00815]